MTTCRAALAVALAAAIALPAAAQGGGKKDFEPRSSKIPDATVDQAIKKGIAYLKQAGRAPVGNEGATSEELVLYTLFHGGCPRNDPYFQKLLKTVVDRAPAKTYSVACAAMCLSELDKVGYQWKLEQYAYFLVNTQCKNGQWSYGEAIFVESKPAPTPTPEPKVTASGPGAPEVKPESIPLYGTRYPPGYRPGAEKKGTTTMPRKRIPQTRRGPDTGDNSNSQYAALGLRACAEAGLEIDPKCTFDALQWWEKQQNNDGGWGYNVRGQKDSSWGSMSMGGVGAAALYNWMLGRPWKKAVAVQNGIGWLVNNWTVVKNPKGQEAGKEHWHYYYLYALERMGMIVGTDDVGTHDWYDEGATYLLKNQKPDGSWKAEGAVNAEARDIWDTCFAILFLRRATRPLTYSGPGQKP